ncbi:MAG: Calx-beta domain-containing protein, partial [Campylobacterota bacterium]|nr:Calx-beta domain-containing protein [Campylobacterota bacterium]
TLSIAVQDDNVFENAESMFVNLSNPTNATIFDDQGEGRILDSADIPSLSVSATEAVEGGYAQFNLQLSNPSHEDVTFDLNLKEGTASSADYDALEVEIDGVWTPADQATIPAGQTEVHVRVKTIDDDIDEPTEQFVLEAVVTSGETTNSTSEGTVSILDNDGEPQIVISDSSVNEEDGVMIFIVSLSNPSSVPVTVEYSTQDGSARSGSDYVGDTNTITFQPGETSQTLSIAVQDDNVFENAESMFVNLSNPTNATIFDDQGEGRILDSGENNDIPTLSISDSYVTEGEYSQFTVQITNPSKEDIKFQFSTQDGTATAGEDYNPDIMEIYEVSSDNGITWSQATEGVIEAGNTAILVRIPTVDDTIFESNEFYTLSATVTEGTTTNNTYPTGTNATATGTIIDDDGAPSIIIGDAVMDEQEGVMIFRVSLTNPSTQDVTVEYSTKDGSATAGEDYTSRTGSITFPAGTTVQFIHVEVSDDLMREGDESFTVELDNPNNADIGHGVGIGTLLDNDTPTIEFSEVYATEGEPAQFVISLSNPSTQDTTVALNLTEGTATSDDYNPDMEVLINGVWTPADQATIPAGQMQVSVRVLTTEDDISEGNESFTISGTVTSGDTVNGTFEATGTIIDDDGAPSIIIGDAVMDEQEGVMIFRVSLTNPSTQDVTVEYSTKDGSATAGEDYTSRTGSITFPAGTTVQFIHVEVSDDLMREGDESFTVELDNPNNADIGHGVGIGTLLDNDTNSAPTITITEDTNNDGILTADELDGGINVSIGIPAGVVVDDVLR